MNEFLNISFEDYVNIDAINYSLLKRVADSGHLYDVVKESDDDGLTIGTVVDDTLLGGNTNKYFFLTKDPPTAMTLQLADLVLKYCKNNQITFDRLKELEKSDNLIYNILDANNLWKRELEPSRRNKYENNDEFFHYIESKLAVDKGDVVITPYVWEKATELSEVLKNHEYTKDIFSTGYNQVTYTFQINGVLYKIRLDKLIIDNNKKVIKPYDLKTGSPKGAYFESNFYKYRYDLQGGLYGLGVAHLANKYFPGYTIDPFRFIYISSTDRDPYPSIWEFSETWAEKAYYGYFNGNYYNKGIKELTEELIFYRETGIKIPKDVYDNKGIVPISLPQ